MTSRLFFSLKSIKPQINTSSGSLSYVTAKEAPGFTNISFAQLTLNKRAILEPIWHPNANKIGYCTEGYLLITMRTPKKIETFTIKSGEIFFIPQGFIHGIENIGEGKGVINFAFNHALPETMYLSEALFSISNSVFTSTFDSPSHFIDGLKNSDTRERITTPSAGSRDQKEITNSYKFAIEESDKVILTKGGYLQVGTKTTLPVLEGLGILGFGLNRHGIVEPHWHTNAGELVYIVKGKTRITVLSPDGQLNVFEVNGGEGAFAPASHFHNIENIGSEDVEVIAFFNNEQPDYIGIGEVVGSYSNEVLASVFNTTPAYFEALKKPESPLVIVPV